MTEMEKMKAGLEYCFTDKEWWHFTLRDEPFPDTYFTFPVKKLGQ